MKTHYDAIIFGGTSGIGLSTAIKFKKLGLSVLSIGRHAETNTASLSNDIHVKNLDILDSQEVENIFSKIQPKHIILSTSAPLQFGTIKDLNLANAKEMFEKVWAYLAIIKEVINKVDNLESIAIVSGAIAKNNVAGTVTLKLMASALNEITKTLAIELAPVRVNAISPGATLTPLYDQFENKEQLLIDMANNTPLKRIAEPNEIADAIVFVTLNKNITGSIIDIDGGSNL
jgi:NAD(P)-dependent dehydrogenase (short-subunit alcohol dehydrogenase family)